MYIYSRDISKKVNPINRIDEYISNGNFDSFILIVPTNRKKRYLLRELIEKSPSNITTALNLFTLGAFAEKLYLTKFPEKRQITSSTQFFLIKKIISESDLQYFHREKKYISSGVVDTLINVISRLKEIGYDEDKFKFSLEEFSGYNKIKLQDIQQIYNSYQNNLTKLNLYEIGDVYLTLNEFESSAIEKIFSERFPSACYLLISGFNEFTQPELDFIEKISLIPNLELNVTLDYFKDNAEVFGNLSESHERLKKIGLNYLEEKDSDFHSNFHSHLKSNLFLGTIRKDVENIRLYKFSAFNIRREVEAIARIIKSKIIENKSLRPSDICIAIKNIEEYSDLIREIFDKYGIPVNVTDRFYLKNSPLITSIVSLFKLVINNYYYKDLFKVLNSSYLKFDKVDAVNLREVISKEKITRDKKRILEAIDNRISYLNKIKGEETGRISFDLMLYQKAITDFKSILRIVDKIDPPRHGYLVAGKKFTPKEFCKNLRTNLDELKLEKNIFNIMGAELDSSTLMTCSKDVRALNLFYEILDEMVYVYELLDLGNKKYSINEFYDYLLSSISGTRYNLKEKAGYGVQVTTPNEIRGLSFSILFLPGLVYGKFPGKYNPLIFLEDKYIKADREKLLEDRYLFYQALNTFKEEVYFSYPLGDEKKEFVVSDFLIALEKIVRVDELDLTTIDESVLSFNDLYVRNIETRHLGNSISAEQLKSVDQSIVQKLEDISLKQKRIEDKKSNEPGSEYAGFITEQELKDKLKKLFEDKYFSITELELFAKCPYKYFLSRVLNISTEEEIEEDITRLEIGNLLHQILYRFFSKLKNEKRDFYDELNSNYDNLKKEIHAIAIEEMEQIKTFNPYFFLVEEYFFGTATSDSILTAFLNFEAEREVKIPPFEFEKMLNAEVLGDNGEKIRLKGKIDRIDFDPTSNVFKVIDYKTGKTIPSSKDLSEYLSLQMPLYMKICEEFFKEKYKNLEMLDSELVQLYKENQKYSAKTHSYQKMMKVKNSTELKNALNQTLSEISNFIKSMTAGNFNLTKVKDYENRVCRNCDFFPVCRINAVTID